MVARSMLPSCEVLLSDFLIIVVLAAVVDDDDDDDDDEGTGDFGTMVDVDVVVVVIPSTLVEENDRSCGLRCNVNVVVVGESMIL